MGSSHSKPQSSTLPPPSPSQWSTRKVPSMVLLRSGEIFESQSGGREVCLGVGVGCFFHGDCGNPLLYFLACIPAMWWTALPHFKLPAMIHCISMEFRTTEAICHGMKALKLCNIINLPCSALQTFLGLHFSIGTHGSIWTFDHDYAQPFNIVTQYCHVQSWC